MGTIVAIIGDLHIGGTTALSTPKFLIHTGVADETQTVEANRAQVWLHECWLDYWDYIRTLAGVRGKTRKHRIVTICLGEFVDGLHHGTTQVMNELSDQIDLAAQVCTPVANLSDGGVFVTIGTEAHSGQAGCNDRAVASRIGAKLIDYELALDIDGVLIDCAHHGRAGQRPWTSAAAGMATEIIVDYATRLEKPPRYAFRGHNHVIDDSGEKFPDTRVICTPSWQLRTAFGYKVAANKKRSDIGGMVINCGELDFTRARYKAAPGQTKVITV